MSIYSDYNNADHGNGRIIEAIVFRERTIVAGDVGTTVSFTFDAKAGNIVPPSTALAFIKTLDGNGGESAIATQDTTNLPDTWGTFTVSIVIPDNTFIGHTLQYGALSRATNFDSSGIFYDNMDVCSEPTTP